MTKIIDLGSILKIDGDAAPGAKGNNGESIKTSTPDYHEGLPGGDATDGKQGGNATALRVNISMNDSNNIVLTVDSQKHILMTSKEIFISARGGDGGTGGNGGNGGIGGKGEDGLDANPYYHGGHGKQGYKGGQGGRGGKGGKGGNGGDIRVNLQEQDIELAWLIKSDCSGGKGGNNGKGGNGGLGGPGGKGGSKYDLSQQVLGSDSQGRTTFNLLYIKKLAGSDAKQGPSGTDGSTPKQENQVGVSGSFAFQIGDTLYPTCFNLEVESFTISGMQSENIVKPGQTITISNITLKNTGGMPSPKGILLQVEQNSCLSNGITKVNDTIAPGERINIKQSLVVRINPQTNPTNNLSLDVPISIRLIPYLSRINRRIDNGNHYSKQLSIQNPFKLSTISMPHIISSKEEAAFAIQVRSNFDSKEKVSLTISVPAEYSNYLALKYPTPHNLTKPYSYFAPPLSRGQVYTFSGTLKFIQPLPTSKISVQFSLLLEDSHTTQKRIVEKRDADLHYGEDFLYRDHDFLLVTHKFTRSTTITAWKNAAAAIGASLTVWSVEQYAGFSYKQKRADGHSISTQLKGKVVIILNNTMTTHSLGQTEILEAAKEGVATFVINNFSIDNAILPFKQASQTTTHKKYLPFMFPAEGALKQEAEKILDEASQSKPTKHFTAIYDFAPVLIQTCPNQYTLGTVSLYEGLSTVESLIATSQHDDNEVTQADQFMIVKLLPFSRKLKLLARANDEITLVEKVQVSEKDKHLLKKAILSDLTAELIAFLKADRSKFNDTNILDALTLQKKLLTYKKNTSEKFYRAILSGQSTSDQLIENDNLKTYVKLVLEYEYEIKKLSTTSDKILFPWTRISNLITKAVLPTIEDWLAENASTFNLAEMRAEIANNWQSLDRDTLYKANLNDKNQQTNKRLLIANQLPSYHAVSSFFKEKRFVFEQDADREQAIKEQTSHCRFY